MNFDENESFVLHVANRLPTSGQQTTSVKQFASVELAAVVLSAFEFIYSLDFSLNCVQFLLILVNLHDLSCINKSHLSEKKKDFKI